MEEFWDNILRYPRYMISVTLGVVYTYVEPLVPLLKRPITAIPLVGLAVSSLVFVVLTLQAMLGLGGTPAL
ncbi:MAG: DUF751 family protein [Elainellaceae cyanobacterium]